MQRRDALRKTLDAHQVAAVTWAHRRLVRDRGVWVPANAEYVNRYRQIGVIFADGVGRGKTWEALVGCARLLEARARKTSGGRRRTYRRGARGHVLVLCPPGLVHKWAHEELRHPQLVAALEAWKTGSRRRQHAARTLEHIIDVRERSHLQVGGKARVRRKWGRHRLEGGTYVVNVNLVAHGQKRFGPSASPGRRLFDTRWDVVIVDEAHHPIARLALGQLEHLPRHVLLLTATPFQLSPGDLRQPLNWLFERPANDYPGKRLLQHPPLKTFMDSVHRASEVSERPPSRAERDEAARLLRNLLARSRPPRSRRRYFVLGQGGARTSISDPWLWTDRDIAFALKGTITPGPAFEATYLRERIRLLEASDDFVSVALRQLLSSFEQYARARRGFQVRASHPKVEAIAAWFEEQLRRDMRAWRATGLPRKTIVFLQFVGDRDAGTRKTLLQRLKDIARRVLTERANHRAHHRALHAIERLRAALVPARDLDGRMAIPLERVRSSLERLALRLEVGDPLTALLECEAYIKRVVRWVKRLRADYERESRVQQQDHDASELERSARQRRRRLLKKRLLGAFEKDFVEAFTGIERDRVGAAGRFCSPWLPWVLVASHVAEEGIDLQTYTKHLVHYELEWNPARMEQREGRGDRRGRKLREPLEILIPLVAKTYEERMLHQLVIRMRWHGVLLGRGATELAEDEGNRTYRQVNTSELRQMQLDLRPRMRS